MRKDTPQERHDDAVEVWGIAAGRGTTAKAARGALCVRSYAAEKAIPKSDWLHFLVIRKRT